MLIKWFNSQFQVWFNKISIILSEVEAPQFIEFVHLWVNSKQIEIEIDILVNIFFVFFSSYLK